MTILSFLRNHARTLMTLICLFTISVLLFILWTDTRRPTYEGSTLVQQTFIEKPEQIIELTNNDATIALLEVTL